MFNSKKWMILGALTLLPMGYVYFNTEHNSAFRLFLHSLVRAL